MGSLARPRLGQSAGGAKVGDVLRFVNGDSVDHEAFVPTKGFGVDLGAQKPGQSTELRLVRSGSFEVECVFHPNMLLKVNVSEPRR